MLLLILGLAVFLGAHLFTRVRGARSELIARIGAKRYRLGYSLVAAVGLALIVLGWRSAPFIPVWSPPDWTRHVTELLVWPAFILVASTHLPCRIREKAKHPMLAGLKLWATAHLVTNGDLAGIVLFGSLLAYGVFARIAIKRSGEPSQLPGRVAAKYDVAAVFLGTAAYILFGAVLHPLLIGVPAFRM